MKKLIDIRKRKNNGKEFPNYLIIFVPSKTCFFISFINYQSCKYCQLLHNYIKHDLGHQGMQL